MKNSSVKKRDCSSHTMALCLAARYGELKKVKRLLNEGSNPEACDNNGRTPLHWAAQNGHLLIVEYLVKTYHVNMELSDNDENTALDLAAYKQHHTVARLLIKNGASVRGQDGRCTTLHLVAQTGTLEEFKNLVKAGANAETGDCDQRSSLHWAAKKNQLDIAKYLLEECHVDITACDKNGCTPLHLAAQNGHDTMVELLVGKGANVAARNKHGCSALDLAAQEGYLCIVQCLQKSGADVKKSDNHGNTPLHLAAENGYANILQYLIDSGADPDARNEYGFTSLHLARENGHTEILQCLKEFGANVKESTNHDNTPRHFSTENKLVDIMQSSLENADNIAVQADLPELIDRVTAISTIPETGKFTLMPTHAPKEDLNIAVNFVTESLH